jgi:hypothetical protein
MRACEACRRRKVKCDGTKPVCIQCQENSVACVYSDRKAVRDKKRLHDLNRKVEEYKTLLQGVSAEVDDYTANTIRAALEVR